MRSAARTTPAAPHVVVMASVVARADTAVRVAVAPNGRSRAPQVGAARVAMGRSTATGIGHLQAALDTHPAAGGQGSQQAADDDAVAADPAPSGRSASKTRFGARPNKLLATELISRRVPASKPPSLATTATLSDGWTRMHKGQKQGTLTGTNPTARPARDSG